VSKLELLVCELVMCATKDAMAAGLVGSRGPSEYNGIVVRLYRQLQAARLSVQP
jgi:hypothetical protein